MDAFPKFLTSVLVIILAVFIGMSLIIAGISMVSAKTFYSSVSDVISSVDAEHEAKMIDECKVIAAENGYVLLVDKQVSEDEKYYYEVTLEYRFMAPFFNKITAGSVTGHVYPGTHLNDDMALN